MSEGTMSTMPITNGLSQPGLEENFHVITNVELVAQVEEDFHEINENEFDVAFDKDAANISDKDFAKYPSHIPRQIWQTLQKPRAVRLLKIISQRNNLINDDDRLECTLEIWNLDQVPGRYVALSYAWGSKGYGDDFIQCNQVTTKIWRNLHTALLHLRKKIRTGRMSQGTLIWVDALCIDQRDPEGMEERQQQILLMKEIFASAARVMIWLGLHDKSSMQIWRSTEFAQPGSPKEMIRNVFQWNIKMREDFIRRPWFRRVWTFQEVILSRKATLLCGDSEMDWHHFCMIWKERYDLMQRLRPEIRERRVDHIEQSLAFLGLMHCFDIQQQVRGPDGEKTMTLPLSEIIIRSWWRDVSEKALHDRIYALLGLVDVDKYPTLRSPDYSLALPKFFEAVVKLAMTVDQTPALLNLAGLSPEDIEQEPASQLTMVRPSWVPDWTRRGVENTWLMGRLGTDDAEARIHAGPRDEGYCTSRPSSWNPKFDGNRLLIHGWIVGYLCSRNPMSEIFKFERISWLEHTSLRWKGDERIKDHTLLDVSLPRMPCSGKTANVGDIVCAFEGIRSLFLVRPMFHFVWGSHYGLEGLQEDISYRGLKLDCRLVGPIQVDGLELVQNPDLNSTYNNSWEIILH